MGAAFASEISAASTWLLDARPLVADGGGARTSKWGWLQDIPPSSLNTAEVLIALEGDERLDRTVFEQACRYVIEGLDAVDRCTARHAGWIALALDRFDESCPCGEMLGEVGSGLRRARAWLVEHQNEDGGWGGVPGEPSMVSTTALAVRAVGPAAPSNTRFALDWLMVAQNGDGGWGLVAEGGEEYQQAKERLRSVEDARELSSSRTDSNAACTAFAMVALQEVGRRGGAEGYAIRRGADWLLGHRERRHTPDDLSCGGWPVFHERGIRANESYTFRHFSTAWAVVALLGAGEDPRSADLLEAIEYLRGLQQPPVVGRDGKQMEGGGWRCSRDGEPYTWATSNAVTALRAAAERFGELGGEAVVDILLRERRSLTASFIGHPGRPWVTNTRTALLVAGTAALLLAAFVAALATTPPSKPVGFLLFALAVALVAAPASVALAVHRSPEAPNVRQSAGLVYTVASVVVGVLGAAYFG